MPAEYPTIEAAVNASSNGDTIQVSPGLYHEHVSVPDTLNQLQIIGNPANPATTIVDGTLNGTVFRLDGNKVTLKGFTVRNAGNGYMAIESVKDTSTNDYHVISNNVIQNSQYAIYLSLSHINTITNNTFINNSIDGIHLEGSNGNIISQNTIQQSVYGIRMITSTSNDVNNNRISGVIYGIYYINSDSNLVHHNVLTNTDSGIYSYDSEYTQLYYNNITQSSYGIRIWCSTLLQSFNNIYNNKVYKNQPGWGIELANSSNNTLTGNWLQECTWGFSLSSAPYNTLYHNNLINNSVQATTNALNTWDKNSQGNHWSDHTSPDANGNGIVDTPYRITPGQDNYPLVRTWSEHDIAVLSVSSAASKVNYGTTVDITVKVRNNANTSVPETFTVTAVYDFTNIGTQTVTNLAQGATQILTFNWNTTGVASGNHTISAKASLVPGELNTDNNNYQDGTVLVTIGDLDHDGDVDGIDFGLFAPTYGSLIGQPQYNRECDFDNDGDVDGVDFGKFATRYGKIW